MSKLLPNRHPQQDFLIPDIFENLPFKDDMASMEHPVFSLSTKPDLRVLEYEYGSAKITISPNHQYGLATIHDKDILLYCGSLLMDEINRFERKLEIETQKAIEEERKKAIDIYPNEEIEPHLIEYGEAYKQEQRMLNPIPKTLRVSSHDLLVSTNRPKDGDGYERLKQALDRLTGTMIKTNIKTGRREIIKAFSLLDNYEIIESSHVKKRMLRLEIGLPDWFYNSFIGGEVKTINRDYFRLRKPLERRLYELAHKHFGDKKSFDIGLEKLHYKTGSKSNLDKFRYMIRKIIEDDHLPDYHIYLHSQDMVKFTRRNAELPLFNRYQLQDFKGETIERARKIIADAGTGWDFNAIVQQFAEHMEKNGNPKNINGAFIGFVKKKVKNST
jgi:hypothetical protein